jgi:hypothetical protein
MSKDQLRSSQVITTYGPGSMVDLPEGSVMIAGLDNWNYDLTAIPAIDEARLLDKLRRLLEVQNLTLRTPPPSTEDARAFHPNVVAWRFPEWFIVQRTETTREGYRRRRLVHLTSLSDNYRSYRDREYGRQAVVPIRFVRACKSGHIGDIDWKPFVHGQASDCPRDLWIEERGTSGELEVIFIVCECGKGTRSMSQAARRDLRALGSCNGARPWLGPGTRESCGQPNWLLIRSASNAYFPQTMSVISIPDSRGPLDQLVRQLWDDFLSDVDTVEDLARARRKPTPASKLQGIDDALVMESISRIRAGVDQDDRPIKAVEFEALSEAKDELGSDVPDGDFFARTLPRAKWDSQAMSAIERVVLVHRLREVEAQVGFTRFEAEGPNIEGELELDVKRAPLALDISWLPAMENRGEGVFIQIKHGAVESWLKRPAVQERDRRLSEGFELWRTERRGSNANFPRLPYYMLHSLSHLLLTAISLECGYPGSSLRERIYAAPGAYGILIHTGSSDAEGTLGGLVLAARDVRRHFARAVESGRLCSNDPVCAFQDPMEQGHQALLGSACHGCLLIAETSCEQRNDFLDRALVVPTLEALGCAFFEIP